MFHKASIFQICFKE